jgi:hypothetical protein
VHIHSYPLDAYDFPGLVGKILDVPDLSALHTSVTVPTEQASDQDTPAHRGFYEQFDRIAPAYHRFLRGEIARLVAEPVYVQRVPTFRVSFPSGTAVSRYHRDSEYHHQPGTINFWVPLTPAFGTNTIWVESEPDLGDFHPIDLMPGQLLRFDAIGLRHGNQRNDTGQARVSFDFRVIPQSSYRATGQRTVSSRIPMEIGQYYVAMPDAPPTGE